MRRVYLLVSMAVICFGAETAFAQSYVWAPAIVDGADNMTIDFGFIDDNKTFSIGDWVWKDLNKDGIQQTGEEPGIPGVLVELWQGNDMIKNTTTEGFPNEGRYIFGGLSDGMYVVRIPMNQSALRGMVNTTPNVPPNDSIDSDGIPSWI